MSLFDYEDGDFMHTISDSMAIGSDGDFMMKLSDNMAMDMESGDIHMVSSWHSDEEDE